MNNIRINTKNSSNLVVSFAKMYGWTTYKQMHTALHKARPTAIFVTFDDGINSMRCVRLRKILETNLEFYLRNKKI